MNLKQLACLLSLSITSTLLMSNSVLAQESSVDNTQQVNTSPANNTGDKKHPAGKPPQSAIDACTNIPAKTQCEFIGPRETQTGFCEMTPDEQYFACKPTRK